jgi:hypothetical protein
MNLKLSSKSYESLKKKIIIDRGKISLHIHPLDIYIRARNVRKLSTKWNLKGKQDIYVVLSLKKFWAYHSVSDPNKGKSLSQSQIEI